MSNSKLVDYTKISPNKTSPRNHAIDTITIHCVVGQCSVETLGSIFAPTSRQASSNYGVGVDGRIGMYVEEKDRSWCSSNAANDNRAITIEVASDTTHPYAVNEKAYAALLDLVTDICRRNGIKKLVWSTNKNERVNHLNGCSCICFRSRRGGLFRFHRRRRRGRGRFFLWFRPCGLFPKANKKQRGGNHNPTNARPYITFDK